MSKKSKNKLSLTELFDDIDNFRVLYLNQSSNERIIENTKKRKLKYPARWYKKMFLQKYEEYIKSGGQKVNSFNEQLYQKLTGQIIKPDRSKRKPSGSKKIKNYTLEDKIKYYEKRIKDKKLTDKQREYAEKQVLTLSNNKSKYIN